MEIAVTMLVCLCLAGSYVYYGQKNKAKRGKETKRLLLLSEFYDQAAEAWNNIELVGMSSDGNSDHEFIQAVRKINMPDYVRIKPIISGEPAERIINAIAGKHILLVGAVLQFRE